MNQTSDAVIASFDRALRTIVGAARASRPNPGLHAGNATLSPQEHRHSAGLMRVNHVGEVCAQALYDAQGQFARTEALRRFGRLDSSRSDEGAGLGLALVQSIAHLHDGELQLADNGPGLLTAIKLPVHPPQAAR